MKKFIQLFAIVGCLLMVSTSTITAQDLVRNITNCDVNVRVGYGPIGGCTLAGIVNALVPAGTTISLGFPAGNEIIQSKGAYTAAPSCAYYIGLPCTSYPLVDFVPCPSSACNDYKARLYPLRGILIYD